MSEPVSTIHYNGLIIEIYWDSNVLVQNSGLWVILPNMTIRNVLYSLGFRNNTINTSSDVLDFYVSSSPKSTIHISNEKPSGIFEDEDIHDADVADESYSDEFDVPKGVSSCFKSIIKKIDVIQYLV